MSFITDFFKRTLTEGLEDPAKLQKDFDARLKGYQETQAQECVPSTAERGMMPACSAHASALA